MAKNSKTVNLADVAKAVARATTVKQVARVGLPKFPVTARITVLAAGKTNPRRKGTGPYNRYATLIKSKTVGDFLKALPKWRATINRAQKEGLIKVG